MISIRPAVVNDCQQIFDFIMELAIYEKAPEQVITNVSEIEQSLFGEGSNAHALICEVDGSAAGMSIYFYNYSTWLGKPGLFLEDLYVSPSYRGKGAGIALMKALASKAVNENCGRFEWNVLDWNTPAIKFYDSIKAEPQSEWLGYRLEGDKLHDFANT
ncbi:MAG: GNAT superfamily N-acetyltransferase [Saprospiraceae bacterium]|jgi:GNAT superfamily N-acetyltransferase